MAAKNERDALRSIVETFHCLLIDCLLPLQTSPSYFADIGVQRTFIFIIENIKADII